MSNGRRGIAIEGVKIRPPRVDLPDDQSHCAIPISRLAPNSFRARRSLPRTIALASRRAHMLFKRFTEKVVEAVRPMFRTVSLHLGAYLSTMWKAISQACAFCSPFSEPVEHGLALQTHQPPDVSFCVPPTKLDSAVTTDSS